MGLKKAIKGWWNEKQQDWKEERELDKKLKAEERTAEKEARLVEKMAFSQERIKQKYDNARARGEERAKKGPLGMRMLKGAGKVAVGALDAATKPSNKKGGSKPKGDPFAALNAFAAPPAPNSNASGRKKKDVNIDLGRMI